MDADVEGEAGRGVSAAREPGGAAESEAEARALPPRSAPSRGPTRRRVFARGVDAHRPRTSQAEHPDTPDPCGKADCCVASHRVAFLFPPSLSALGPASPACVHLSAALGISRRWEKKNKIVYPPQLPGEPRRPAEIYHCRRQIKYSRDKMWYLAKLIRGMSIDQALAQLEFNDKKGAQIIKEILLEAQEMAVRDHNVEFRSNLYIAESTSGRGQYLKRIRYHGRGRFGIMEKVYCHYFVKLVEGPPPPPEPPKTAVAHAREYVQELRNRTIIHTL